MVHFRIELFRYMIKRKQIAWSIINKDVIGQTNLILPPFIAFKILNRTPRNLEHP